MVLRCHCPPRGVGVPSAVSWSAICCSVLPAAAALITRHAHARRVRTPSRHHNRPRSSKLTAHNGLFGDEWALGPRWWGWGPPESGLTHTDSEEDPGGGESYAYL